MRPHTHTLLAACLCVLPAAASGQAIEATFALSKSAYMEGAYEHVSGDWQADLTARYPIGRRFRLGVGGAVGKFDAPESDPSFTSWGVWLEPSLGVRPGERVRAWLGARYGWAHERAGPREAGLWAYGWQAGLATGVDRALGEAVGLGIQAELMRLDLARDDDDAPAGVDLDREGWRASLGISLRFGGR